MLWQPYDLTAICGPYVQQKTCFLLDFQRIPCMCPLVHYTRMVYPLHKLLYYLEHDHNNNNKL